MRIEEIHKQKREHKQMINFTNFHFVNTLGPCAKLIFYILISFNPAGIREYIYCIEIIAENHTIIYI